MTTISIKYCNIPSSLQKGDFYRSLSCEDPHDLIEIPADCFYTIPRIVDNNLGAICNLLKTSLFWVLDEIPVHILDYCHDHAVEVWRDSFSAVPGAAESGILAALLNLYSRKDIVKFQDSLQTGRWEFIVHAVKRMKRANDDPTYTAAYVGNLRALKLLHTEGFPWHADTCVVASWCGLLDCLIYAHENGCRMDGRVYHHAAERGHLQCVQYAHQQGVEWDVKTCERAASGGHLQILQFAHQNGCPWDFMALAAAAKYNHLECLKYALQHGCPAHENASCVASMVGNLACLELLHHHGAPWSAVTCYHAAKCGDLSCLRYLRENGCPWDNRTVQTAAKAGCIAVLQYAMENGCEYDANTLVALAAYGRNVDCIRYLVEVRHCPLVHSSFIYTLLAGDLACLTYVIRKGCPLSAKVTSQQLNNLAFCDGLFRANSAEFLLCLQLALKHGWAMNAAFKQFLFMNDGENCKEILKANQSYFGFGNWLK